MGRWTHYFYAAFLCLLVSVLYYSFFVSKAHVEVDLAVESKAEFKIYWAEKGQPYSEKNMSVVTVHPGKSQYGFFLTDIKDIARLRIDTHNYAGEAFLKSFTVEQEGYVPLSLSRSSDFSKLVPLAQIEDFRVGDNGLWVKSTGEDPNFELLISPEYKGIKPGWLILRFAIISFFTVLIYLGVSPLARDFLFVPVMLAGVWALIIVMAGISQRNVHPDEYVHLYATSYYDDHWLPPALEDDSISDTYSVYGISRLNNGEIYYLISGKFHKLLENFKIPEYFSLRMFNICLFGFILLYTIKSRHARLVAIPFLISPQIWYLFSYCTSDAFALFIAFLAGCELVNPTSMLNKFLKGKGWKLFPGLLLLGILLGCLFLLKKNYYPFIAFFYLCLAGQFFFNSTSAEQRKTALKRLAIVTFLGLIIFGLRVGADYKVNGLDRQTKIDQIQEELAAPWYKPSTELHKKHITLYRKARGTTLKEMVTVERWFEKSFQTGFGVYGYFTISSSRTYYDLVRWTGVGLLCFVFGSIFLRGGLVNSSLALALLALSGALIAVSLRHSWVVDFQAQGRYLFPIVPMLGILYARTYKVIHQPLLILGVTGMYLLGMYSFIFEGLVRIPKVIVY